MIGLLLSYKDLILNIEGRFLENERFIAWSTGIDSAGFSITKPFDGQAASVGNGTMVAIQVASQEQVDAFYKKALSLGATCEGEPGPRGEMSGFYAGYFRDLDGNKLNAFHIDMPANNTNPPKEVTT